MIHKYDEDKKEWIITGWFDLGEIIINNPGANHTVWEEKEHIYIAIALDDEVHIYRRMKLAIPVN